MAQKLAPLQKAFAVQQLYRVFKPKPGTPPAAQNADKIDAGLTAVGLLLSSSRSRSISKIGMLVAGGAVIHRLLSDHSTRYNRWTSKILGNRK